jgi:hypothetical protein
MSPDTKHAIVDTCPVAAGVHHCQCAPTIISDREDHQRSQTTPRDIDVAPHLGGVPVSPDPTATC